MTSSYPRVFFETELTLEQIELPQSIRLDDRDLHHLCNVLRLKPKQKVHAVCKNSGIGFLAELSRSDSPGYLNLIERLEGSETAAAVATIAASLCKGKKNDLICEKATELGVEQILFWQSERSVVRLSASKDIESRLLRLQRIAESAAKQSGRYHVPKIGFLPNVSELIAFYDASRCADDSLLLCSLASSAKPLRDLAAPGGKAHIVIGPEGDLAPSESEQLISAGFVPVSLGPAVLRSETAAIAAIAIANGLWGPA